MLLDHLLKTRKEYKILKKQETEDIYQNKLEKACCEHDLAYGDYKYLPNRAASEKVICDKAFNIAKSPKYDAYQAWLTSMIYKFFNKKSAATHADKSAGVFTHIGTGLNSENHQLVDKLHKQIIRKELVDSTDMQLISEI